MVVSVAILELQTVLQSQAMLTLLKCHQISVNNLTDTQCLNPASSIKSLNKSQNQKENSGISTHKVHIINHFNCLLKLFDLIKSFPKPIGQFIGVNRNALAFSSSYDTGRTVKVSRCEPIYVPLDAFIFSLTEFSVSVNFLQ